MAANGDGVVFEGKRNDGGAVDGRDGRGPNLLFDVFFHVRWIPGSRLGCVDWSINWISLSPDRAPKKNENKNIKNKNRNLKKVMKILFNPIDHKRALGVIFDIGVQFGPELDPEVVGRFLHVRPREAEHGDSRGDSLHDGRGHVIVATHHAIQRSVRLHVVEWDALAVQEPAQSSHLVDGHGRQLVRLQLHFASAEALQIGQARVRADLDAVRLAEPHSLHHDERVAGVEPTGDVGLGDEGKEFFIRTLWMESSDLSGNFFSLESTRTYTF